VGGEKERGATGAGGGVNDERGSTAGSGPGEFENVRGAVGVVGDMGRGTSATCGVDVGGSTGRENVRGPAAGDGRVKADPCTVPGCALANVRDWMGRAVDCAKLIARGSWEARIEGTASAGTCASAIVGPRAADGRRYELLATPAVAPMYGRVRGAIAAIRSLGTM
jgi:hypothetical protein